MILCEPFTVWGAPRTKKNSPIITGKRLIPSAAYRKWFKQAQLQAPQIRLGLVTGVTRATLLKTWSLGTISEGVYSIVDPPTLPIKGLVSIRALFYRERNSGDLLGFEEALADWMQVPRMSKRNPGKLSRDGAGIIEDDRQIVSWDGSRPFKDAEHPRIEVRITIFEEHESKYVCSDV